MEDLRKLREENKKFHLKKILQYIWKNKWYIIATIVVLFLLIFPGFFGQFLGQWINNFITNFTNYLN